MRCVFRGALSGVSGAAIAAIIACPATAGADKLITAPPGSWVVPVAVPAEDGKGADTPIKLLLLDEQDDLQPGKVTRYFESVFKVQTPQGLSAGAVSFAWNPDIQTPIVHKLLIRRGTQVIDVLASGQSFTVMRRETNLENAVLDGQLTASIQPEGLQVGDIVDFSASIVTSDPAIGNHIEEAAASWNGVPLARAHMRAQWPSSVPMRIQTDGGMATPKIVRRNGLSSIEVSMDGVQSLVKPKGAPTRFQYGRLIEMTDLSSWNGVAALMAPLYAKAEALPTTSPLQAEIAKIKAGSADPKAQAEAALALVQDRVRYVFLGMNDGGLVPADADTTWSRRFGDCKGKTVLLLALLHGLGIDAHPVIVSTALGDGLDTRLPEIGLFDHVLVQATIGGRSFWLDGTRVGDRSLDGIETPYFRWGLPLVPGNATLVAMVPPPFAAPQVDVAIRIDASAGLTPPAPIHIDRIVRGDDAIVANIAISSLVGDARDQALREFWRQKYDFAEPKTVTVQFDPDKRELHLAMDGTTKMDWSRGWYEADHVWVGYTADFSRDPGPNHDAPYAVGYPDYTHVTETILLPPRSGTFTITPDSDVDQTVAGIEYHRHAKIEGDRFLVDESDRATAPEFPATQAPAAQDTLRALAKKGVFVNRPADYRGTPAEMQAIADTVPTTAQGFVEKGAVYLSRRDADGARGQADKAIELDPKMVAAYSLRAMAALTKTDLASAKADIDKGLAINPRDPGILTAQGLYAQSNAKAADAIAAYTAAIAQAPNNSIALINRATEYAATGQVDLAMADSDAALKLEPQAAQMHLLRANILHGRGDIAGTIREADAILSSDPKETFPLVAAAKIYAACGKQEDAMRALDAALAIKQEGYIYLNRYHVRPKSDLAGRQADLDTALKLEPTLDEAIATKAQFQGEHGDWAGAVVTLTTAIARKPTNADLLAQRAVAYAKLGDQARAIKGFDTASTGVTSADAHNALCYDVATTGVLLSQALDECNKAIALAPDVSNIRDSLAFVLLRLGRIDEALVNYDKVLAKAPAESSSLYGRSLAEARKGDKAAADRDAAAALKLDPDVRETFEGYGMTAGSSVGKAPDKPATAKP